MVNKTLYTIRNNKSKSGVCDSSNVNKNKKQSRVKIKKKIFTRLCLKSAAVQISCALANI